MFVVVTKHGLYPADYLGGSHVGSRVGNHVGSHVGTHASLRVCMGSSEAVLQEPPFGQSLLGFPLLGPWVALWVAYPRVVAFTVCAPRVGHID